MGRRSGYTFRFLDAARTAVFFRRPPVQIARANWQKDPAASEPASDEEIFPSASVWGLLGGPFDGARADRGGPSASPRFPRRIRRVNDASKVAGGIPSRAMPAPPSRAIARVDPRVPSTAHPRVETVAAFPLGG